MKQKTMTKKIFRQAGFTLIELAIASAIAAMALTIGLYFEAAQMRYEVARSQADQLLLLNGALVTYETNYFTQLQYGQPVSGVANPKAPTVAELKSLGLLDNTFSPSNFYNGAYATQINVTGPGGGSCSPPNCNVTGLVYLTTPVTDATGNVDLAALGDAMAHAAGASTSSLVGNALFGYSPTSTPATIYGANGAWSVANPKGSVAGILAIENGYNSSGLSQFLRRDGTLPMTGHLDMASNDVVNAKNITADSGGNVNVNGNENVSGNATINGNETVNGNATIVQNFSAGYGRITGDTSGNLNASGLVTAYDYKDNLRGHLVSSYMGDWVHIATVNVGVGSWVWKPSCPEGGFPRIIVVPQSTVVTSEGLYGNGQGGVGPATVVSNAWALDKGSYWLTYFAYQYNGSFGGGWSYGGNGLAEVYCYEHSN